MALITGDVLGRMFRGKIGNYVVYERLGKLCIRSCPEGFVPMGAGQVAQRERLRSASIFYKAVRAAGLADYWKQARRPAGWTGNNAFVSANLPAFSAEGYIEGMDKVVLVPEAGLQLPDDLRLEPGEGDCWVLTWRNATDYPAQQDADRVMVALMRGGKYFDVRILEEVGIASRGEGRAVFRIPEGWEEYRHLYCFLASEDRSHASASRYLGMLGQSGTR